MGGRPRHICSSRSSRDAVAASRGHTIQVEKAKVSSHDARIGARGVARSPEDFHARARTRVRILADGPLVLELATAGRENGTFLLVCRAVTTFCRDSA